MPTRITERRIGDVTILQVSGRVILGDGAAELRARMIPDTTTGVPWSEPAPGKANTHFGASRWIVVLLICVSVV